MQTTWALIMITKGLLWGTNATRVDYPTVDECLAKRDEYYKTPEGSESFSFCVEGVAADRLGYRL